MKTNGTSYRDFWKGARVLVTGATGLIGSWLVKELLANEAFVVVLLYDADPQSELLASGDIKHVSVVNGALEDFFAIERAVNGHEINTVIHLGAQTIVSTAHRFPLPTFEANIRGTYNLLEVCRVHSDLVQQIVIASSDKAYGEQPVLPYTETMPLKGKHPYEVSKSCADMLAQSYFHTYKLPITIARCGNVYGGGDLNWNRIVPGTIRSLYKDELPIIRSNGKDVRDYIYVKDIARAYMRLAECTQNEEIRGEAFNFSTEFPMTVLELVNRIQTLMAKSSLQPRILDNAKGEIQNQRLSTAKARERLGWKPAFDMDIGLAETIDWYLAFLDK